MTLNFLYFIYYIINYLFTIVYFYIFRNSKMSSSDLFSIVFTVAVITFLVRLFNGGYNNKKEITYIQGLQDLTNGTDTPEYMIKCYPDGTEERISFIQYLKEIGRW